MQTEISQQRNSAERKEREGAKESESTVASGSWSTDSTQRISILYLAKSTTNHWGGCQTYLKQEPFRPPSFLMFPLSLSLSLSLSLTFLRFAHCERPTGTGALLFLYFSLPFSPYFSSARVTFSLNTERAGRSKDAGATAANDMRPAAAGQLGNSRTQDLGLPRNEPSRKVPTTSFSRYEWNC